jgi:hypothetical protein
VKPRHAVIVLTVLATAIAVLGGCGVGADDVDRAAYLSENRELLTRAPLFPGSRRVSVRHEATHYSSDDCLILCDSYIDGYITHVTFKSPSGTTAAQITRFFDQQLPPLGWRRANWGNLPAGWPHRTTGKPYVTNVGYQSGDASMSVDLIPFIQGNTIIRGGRFIVNVNHEGYRPR